jgi:hypothetical protein
MSRKIKKTPYIKEIWKKTEGDERMIMFILYMDVSEYENEEAKDIMRLTGDIQWDQQSFHKAATMITNRMKKRPK